MTDELDDLDRQILALLTADGRLPAAQIAERVGLSRPAVADRIEKLERSGVILGTTVVVDPRALGGAVTAFVATRGTAGMSPRAFRGLMKLSERPEVLEFHSVAGDDCYLFKVRTGSIGALNAFVSLLASPPFSLSTRTTIAMQTHFEKVGGVTLEGKTSNEA